MRDYGSGPGIVRGLNGRYRQTTIAKIPSRGAKKAVRHYTVIRKCEEPGCITLVSVYTKGRLCNIHAGKLSLKEARAAVRMETTDKVKEYQRTRQRKRAAKKKVIDSPQSSGVN